MKPEYLQAWDKWHTDRKCEHVHCPLGCEHPQPMLTDDGRMLCMSCWVRNEVMTEVEPCTPTYCND